MEQEITSLENSRVKRLVKLRDQRKVRYEEHCFLLEGVRLALDAVSSGAQIDELYYTENAYNRFGKELKILQEKARQIFLVTDEIFSKIADTESPQGVLLVCPMLDKPEISSKIKKNVPYMVLEKISDPGNLGTIFRSADALGGQLLLVGSGVDPYSPKVVRATMGSLFRVPFEKMNSAEAAFEELNSQGRRSCAAVLHQPGAIQLSKAQFMGNEAIWIGNEGHGLEESTIAQCDTLLTIDMHGHTESLNAATAASIFLWELSKAL